MCDTCPLKSKKDETVVRQSIDRIVSKKGKGFLMCLKNDGWMSVHPDVLVQCLMSTSPAPQPNPQTNLSTGFQEKNGDAPNAAAESYSGQSQNLSDWEAGHGCSALNMQQPSPQASATIHPPTSTNGESVLLRSLLRYGRISHELKDLQMWTPEFIVPKYMEENLLKRYRATPVTGVTILSDKYGSLRSTVNPKLVEISRSNYEGIQIAANETLMLKTLIRNGLASFQESDVHFRHGNWEIPQYVVKNLKDEYCSTPRGELYIISDEKQNLRSIVKIGKFNKMLTFAKKKWKDLQEK